MLAKSSISLSQIWHRYFIKRILLLDAVVSPATGHLVARLNGVPKTVKVAFLTLDVLNQVFLGKFPGILDA
jgi:hypothetical protein